MADIIGASILIIGLLISIILVALKPREDEVTSSNVIDQERSKTESPIERRLYDALLSRGHYIVTQYPMGRYRIDIAFPQYKLAVECDGRQFHSTKEAMERDRRKDNYLRSNGWTVIRISGRTINKSLPTAVKRIEDKIELKSPISN